MARMTIILHPDEKSALIAFAEHEHRDPRLLAGLLLRRELESAGFLQPTKAPTISTQETPHATGRFQNHHNRCNFSMIREILADLCHRQWSGWMEYLFSKGTFNQDGTWTMPAWAVERWKRQMKTPYANLSDSEQESDRVEADKFLEILCAHTDGGSVAATTKDYEITDYEITWEDYDGITY